MPAKLSKREAKKFGFSAGSKYKNKKTEGQWLDGKTVLFDSKKEAKRAQELLLLFQQGEISDLTRQREFRLTINGILICKYECDFLYRDLSKPGRAVVVEDVKGMKTRVYRLKKKLMFAIFGIKIKEV